MIFKRNSVFLATLCVVLSMNVTKVAAEDALGLYRETTISLGNNLNLTPEKEEVLKKMSDLEQEYLEYGLSEPVRSDPKDLFRAAVGEWSWRDGLICVTNEGIGTRRINTWHAAIVAPQLPYVVAEAPGVTERVRYRSGEWSSSHYTVWQVGVNSTSVQQDWNAGHWAGEQKGKPYNLNFWNAKQTGSFYCSQLVWAAYYYTAGVDLNKGDNDIVGAIAIHPGEFIANPNTTIVYRNR